MSSSSFCPTYGRHVLYIQIPTAVSFSCSTIIYAFEPRAFTFLSCFRPLMRNCPARVRVKYQLPCNRWRHATHLECCCAYTLTLPLDNQGQVALGMGYVCERTAQRPSNVSLTSHHRKRYRVGKRSSEYGPNGLGWCLTEVLPSRHPKRVSFIALVAFFHDIDWYKGFVTRSSPTVAILVKMTS
jgi:hypothetical protein